MTYVELIVVLGIFAIITGVSLFNYKNFQAKVDIKNLANDMALKIVEAQKDSIAGKIPFGKIPQDPETWKPSYGVFFDSSLDPYTAFYYFTDLISDKKFDGITIPCASGGGSNGECLDVINITKGNSISGIQYYLIGDDSEYTANGGFSITFTRPDFGATFALNNAVLPNIDRAEIWVYSPGLTAYSIITVHSSGRIEIN